MPYFVDFTDSVIKSCIAGAEYGIEKESLRITPDGRLAQTKHYFDDERHISRDFCENQPELITDVFGSAEQVTAQLRALHAQVNQKLKEHGELLWCFSNPPLVLSEDEIPVAELDAQKSAYRHYLAEKYGKAKMLYSGIHLNFSFPDDVLTTLFAHSGAAEYKDYVCRLYTALAKRLVEYSWLIVYLTAASPVADSGFLKMIGADETRCASYRCGDFGYWNHFTPLIDFSSLERYVSSIEAYIRAGRLQSPSELYYPVRLKSGGKSSLKQLTENGITHIELRMLDVNPLSNVGIFREDIEFIHLLMLYLLSLKDAPFPPDAQLRAIQNMKSAALLDDSAAQIGGVSLRNAALDELNKITQFTAAHFPAYTDIVRYQSDKILKHRRYAEVIVREFGENYMEKGIALAKKYRG